MKNLLGNFQGTWYAENYVEYVNMMWGVLNLRTVDILGG